MFRFIGLLFFSFFVLDIASIIVLGMSIGAFNAIGCVFASIIIGILLLKFAFARFNRTDKINGVMMQNVAPYHMVLLLCGFLFIMPGFVSDILALILTLKPLHKALGFIIKPLMVVLLKKQLKDNYAFFAQNVKSEFGQGTSFSNGSDPFGFDADAFAKKDSGNVYEANFSVEKDETVQKVLEHDQSLDKNDGRTK